MGLTIKEVSGKGDLKDFVKFPFQLYKDNPNWVPPMIKDELDTFNPKKNPSFEHCEAKMWLAVRDGKTVGRIAGIIHQTEAKEKQIGRFGWIDFVDDPEVSKLLLDTVIAWLQSNGITGIHGPLGFTDMDFEGMLVEGFDEIGTIATIYNYPYYPAHLEKLGFKKAAEWMEMEGQVPKEVPHRLKRKSEIIEARFKVRSLKFGTKNDLLKYGHEIFGVLNASYEGLYGYYKLTDKQIENYINQYFSFINPEFSSVVVNDKNTVVGFGISMPSLSKAFQKAKGQLFPFGFLHMLKALKFNKTADLYLIGVLPNYQKMGIPLLIIRDIWSALIKNGFNKVYSNPALEDNNGILNHWLEYQDIHRIRKRRRCYIKKFD
ncbi:MAG: hypothetical protein RJQ09_19805 [Cyclobacteriaceae bacterium]